jgi:hypothetical protein
VFLHMTSVVLHVYDLSQGMAKQLSPMLLGRSIGLSAWLCFWRCAWGHPSMFALQTAFGTRACSCSASKFRNSLPFCKYHIYRRAMLKQGVFLWWWRASDEPSRSDVTIWSRASAAHRFRRNGHPTRSVSRFFIFHQVRAGSLSAPFVAVF